MHENGTRYEFDMNTGYWHVDKTSNILLPEEPLYDLHDDNFGDLLFRFSNVFNEL